MRHRERSSRTLMVVQSFAKTSPTSGTTTSTWSEPVGPAKTIDDCITPGYQRIVARGGVVPYLPVRIETRDIKSVTPLSGQVLNISPPYTISWGDHIGAAVNPYIIPLEVDEADSAIIATVMNQAIAKAKMGDWDALTSLAEASKSVRGIGDRVNKTFDFATRYAQRARRRKTSGERIKQFNELWMEGRYQWRPVVGEIGDIMNHLSKGSRSMQEGRSSASSDLARTLSAPDVVSGPRIWNRSSTIEGTRTYRGYALAVGEIASANMHMGQTMWEVVPYSWLIDKFINIGSAINAWAPVPGVEIQASGYSIHDTYEITQRVGASPNPSSTNTTCSYTDYVRVISVDRYRRFPSGAMVPRLYPRLKPADFLDILALTVSRASRVMKLLT